MASCGIICVKYLMFLFNLLFALTGLLILTVGAIIQSSYNHYSNFVDHTIWVAPILLIIVGSIVFIIAFFGCCGAVKENSCMVLTFSVFLIIIFLLEIGIGIAGYVKHGQLEDILEKGFNSTLHNYDKNVDSQHAWSLIQSELKCCGIQGPSDWQQVFHNTTLPTSCCIEMPVNVNQCTKEFAMKDGCMPELLALLQKNALILAGVGIGIAVVQLLAVCFACCLSRAFKRNYEAV
ncbi:CD63 antigen [Phlebotomus argentipes]|uniref:CD63 antigen n=1 Tax=Phlebotomus argentipes TaxID=94469 RepID=UPI0028936ED0|nr:CD63 antigen [Phlebotomus argentipes]XP_059616982.1 CD63 antigen [Phlebotomus argentipes]